MKIKDNNVDIERYLNEIQADLEKDLGKRYPGLNLPSYTKRILAAVYALQPRKDYNESYKKQWGEAVAGIEFLFAQMPNDFDFENGESFFLALIGQEFGPVKNKFSYYPGVEESLSLWNKESDQTLPHPALGELKKIIPGLSRASHTHLDTFLKAPTFEDISLVFQTISQEAEVLQKDKLLYRLVELVGLRKLQSSMAFATLAAVEQLQIRNSYNDEVLLELLHYGLVANPIDLIACEHIISDRDEPEGFYQQLQKDDCTEETYGKALENIRILIQEKFAPAVLEEMPVFFSKSVKDSLINIIGILNCFDDPGEYSLQDRKSVLRMLYNNVRNFAKEKVRPVVEGLNLRETDVPEIPIATLVEVAVMTDEFRREFDILKAYQQLYNARIEEGNDRLSNISEAEAKNLLRTLGSDACNPLPEEHPISFANYSENPDYIERLSRNAALEHLREFMQAEKNSKGRSPMKRLEVFQAEANAILQGDRKDGKYNGVVPRLTALMEEKPGLINPYYLKQAKALQKEIQQQCPDLFDTVRKYEIATDRNPEIKKKRIQNYIQRKKQENPGEIDRFIDLSWVDLNGVDVGTTDFDQVIFKNIEQIAVADGGRRAKGLPYSPNQIKKAQERMKKPLRSEVSDIIPSVLETIATPSTTPYTIAYAEAVVKKVQENNPGIVGALAEGLKQVTIVLLAKIKKMVLQNCTVAVPKGLYAGIGVVISKGADGRVMVKPMSNAAAERHTPAFNGLQGETVELKEITDSQGKWVSIADKSPSEIGELFKGLVGTSVSLRYKTANGTHCEKAFDRQLINADHRALETLTENMDIIQPLMQQAQQVIRVIQNGLPPEENQGRPKLGLTKGLHGASFEERTVAARTRSARESVAL
ncbi:MAG: hypothetical protein K0R63_1485 [Rickettsiales bacterium]|jgi:hypothetical protein|nr:hypothetical protein [Rickettsiales bacterium]